jgi:hypothetical protein
VVEYLPSKHEVLSSNPSTAKSKQNKNLIRALQQPYEVYFVSFPDEEKG